MGQTFAITLVMKSYITCGVQVVDAHSMLYNLYIA